MFLKAQNGLQSSSSANKKKQTTLSSLWKPPTASEVSEDLASSEPLIYEEIKVRCQLPNEKYAAEGRAITVEFPSFFLINCYVPNAGDGLVRLDYRIDEW